MDTRRDVFQAIADPTRRAIIGLIASQALSINAIAQHFEISRPAISQHVKLLEECGMVKIVQEGRERFCIPQLDQMTEVANWVNQYRQFWESKLDALDIYLDKIQSKPK